MSERGFIAFISYRYLYPIIKTMEVRETGYHQQVCESK